MFTKKLVVLLANSAKTVAFGADKHGKPYAILSTFINQNGVSTRHELWAFDNEAERMAKVLLNVAKVEDVLAQIPAGKKTVQMDLAGSFAVHVTGTEEIAERKDDRGRTETYLKVIVSTFDAVYTPSKSGGNDSNEQTEADASKIPATDIPF